jgi:hypothetical protein
MIGRFVPYERMFLFIVAGRLIDRERALLLSPTRIRRRRQQQHQQRKRRQWPLWFCLWTPYRRTRNASTQVVRAGHSYWHLDTQESWERKVIAPLITEGMEKADCPTAQCLCCAAIVDDMPRHHASPAMRMNKRTDCSMMLRTETPPSPLPSKETR